MSDNTTAVPARALPPAFGPKPGQLRRVEVRRQVEALGTRLEQRAQRLLDSQQGEATGPWFADMAKALGEQLLESDQAQERRDAAMLIADTLLDVGERHDATFWRSDLGRALAREGGYPGPWPSHGVAEAVLQVSRQAIDQMAGRGDLHMEARLISRASLRTAAAKRWPREEDQ